MSRVQTMSRSAFAQVERRIPDDRTPDKQYSAFAKSFPALIHAAGLCQAVAFAQSQGDHSKHVLEDVIVVMGSVDGHVTQGTLPTDAREARQTQYLRLSRLALDAASWVKRYVEAFEAATPREAVR